MEDFTPYGFVEAAVVEKFNLDSYPFELTDCTAHMVSQPDFERISSLLDGHIVRANIDGAMTFVTKWYASWCVIEALTDGDVKSTDMYRRAESDRASMSEGDVLNHFDYLNRGVEAEVIPEPEPEPEPEEPEDVPEEVETEEEDEAAPDILDDNFSKVEKNGRRIFYKGALQESAEAVPSNLFEGLDIVITNTKVYGNPISEYAATSIIGLPNAAVICLSGDADTRRTATPFGADASLLSSGGTTVNAGDYAVAEFVGDKVLNVLYSKNNVIVNPILLTVFGAISGTEYEYVYDPIEDEMAKRPNSKKLPSGKWVFDSDECYIRLSDHYGKHVLREDVSIPDSIVFSGRLRNGNSRELIASVLCNEVRAISLPDNYSDYDRVYRDTVSNIVFALAKGNTIYTTSDAPISAVIDGIIARDQLKTYDEIHASDVELYSDVREGAIERYVGKFVADAKSYITKNKAELEDKTEAYERKLKETMALASEIKSLSVMLSSIDEEKIASDNRELAVKDYANIEDIDVVSSVMVDGDYITVFTNNIYVKHDTNGKWYDIGTFVVRVKISKNGVYSEDYTRIYNTKNYTDAYESGMNAPHVFRRGNLCHGNLTMGISESYKTGDMFGVVYQLITFLQSANLDDVAGAKLTRWEEVSEEVALGHNMDSETVYGIPDGFDMSAALSAVI